MKNTQQGYFVKRAAVLFVSLLATTFISQFSLSTSHSIEQNIEVQLLGINDFHGQIDTSKKVNNRSAGRADYLAAYLKERERTNPNTLLVHAGDAVGGSSPSSALLQDEPAIHMLNELGFDVGTVGNHEFDEGVQEMMRLIDGGKHPKTAKRYGEFQGANFPYAVANVVDKDTNKTILDPYVIKEVKGKKIGFIGVVYSDTPNILDSSKVKDVKFTDEVTAINKYSKELKDQGIEAIVVLAHNPGKSEIDGSKPTGEIVDFARQVDDEVDVIFGAHNHTYLNSVVDGKLLVQAYSAGTAFADVDLVIDAATGDIIEKKAEIIVTYQDAIEADRQMTEIVAAYQEDVSETIHEKIGETGVELTRGQNAAGESDFGTLIADSMRHTMNTDFAFIESAGIRADLDAGPITWGELFTALPFGNRLMSLTMTGSQVRDALNQQWSPKKRMLQISGLKYTWSNELPAGQKVVDIYLPTGEKINPDSEYSVAVNTFLAMGKDNFTAFTNGKNRVKGPVDLDALTGYVEAQPKPIIASAGSRVTKLNNEFVLAPKVDLYGAVVSNEP
ncbi:bifunctional metallophosphatase/5'-nucleotidase [Bacillus sp. V33-4]|nr:5'-nucleotidase C-terminal domain-containing protein [Bacillus sp. V33-4]PLR83402.1 bifunctional metallophosphatase/5'-nucleotidase [Bacillus sp. V33-4]